MATTASAIVQGALETIGVLGEGQTLSAAQGADGLRRLNLMIGSWALQPLTIPTVAREVFAITSGKGSPANPYTIGTGGNLNTARPATQQAITGAGLLLNSADPDPVEIPIAILTDDMYQAIQIKDLANSQPTQVYYRPDFPLGKLFLWPVPNTTINSLVLYLRKTLTQFSSLTASYELPEGAAEAVEYNLALRLCGPYSVPVDADVKATAKSSLGAYKRANYKLYDLFQDPATTHSHAAGYNINTDQSGGY